MKHTYKAMLSSFTPLIGVIRLAGLDVELIKSRRRGHATELTLTGPAADVDMAGVFARNRGYRLVVGLDGGLPAGMRTDLFVA